MIRFKIKLAISIITLIILTGCASHLVNKNNQEFDQIISDLKLKKGNYSSLKTKYPQFEIKEYKTFKNKAFTELEKAVTRLKENEVTNVIKNKDSSCGVAKVNEILQSVKMRVSYIYLADSSEKARVLADKILEEYKSGKPFAKLAEQYSQDGNSKKGGDMGWFDEKNVVKDFSEAIRNHNKGEVFKALTSQYGWYVISYTHEIEEVTEFDIVEVIKKNCN